jgi:putative hydrolase of the HAD superfamily
VIFDLWDTLADWPMAESIRLRNRIAAELGLPEDEFTRRWHGIYRASQTGPLADAFRELGLSERELDAHVEAWRTLGRNGLRPRDGATETLAELRRRGVKLAVLSACDEAVPATWPSTDFAGLFDAETFSFECGLMKPDPEIYLHTAEALGADPAACLFVGDGANDELRGAERVGMTAALFLPEGAVSPWANVQEWDGLRVTSYEQVLELC